jgi:hypothetical protein
MDQAKVYKHLIFTSQDINSWFVIRLSINSYSCTIKWGTQLL